jgi:hypothetical protein
VSFCSQSRKTNSPRRGERIFWKLSSSPSNVSHNQKSVSRKPTCRFFLFNESNKGRWEAQIKMFLEVVFSPFSTYFISLYLQTRLRMIWNVNMRYSGPFTSRTFDQKSESCVYRFIRFSSPVKLQFRRTAPSSARWPRWIMLPALLLNRSS